MITSFLTTLITTTRSHRELLWSTGALATTVVLGSAALATAVNDADDSHQSLQKIQSKSSSSSSSSSSLSQRLSWPYHHHHHHYHHQNDVASSPRLGGLATTWMNVTQMEGKKTMTTTTTTSTNFEAVDKKEIPTFLSSSSSSSSSAITNDDNNDDDNDESTVMDLDRPFMLFLGTGSSTGCPKPLCTMKYRHDKHHRSGGDDHHGTTATTTATATATTADTTGTTADIPPSNCHVSHLAIQDGSDPRTNKNYRNNPSFLIHHYDTTTQSYKNIIIDVGKTFRETTLRWFPHYNIRSLDAIILTHHHMDAAGGLDDVRGFQQATYNSNNNKNNVKSSTTTSTTSTTGNHTNTNNPPPKRKPIPIYMSPFCFDNVSRQFPWLFPTNDITMPRQYESQPQYYYNDDDKNKATCYDCRLPKPTTKNNRKMTNDTTPTTADNDVKVVVKRDVAAFDVTLFEDFAVHTIDNMDNGGSDTETARSNGFSFVPLPVWHGDDLMSHGFAFTLQPGPPVKIQSSSLSSSSSSSSLQQQPSQQPSRQRPLNVVYLSDLSRMVPQTLEYIQTQLPSTDILIIDSLLWHKVHPVHYSLEQAVELATTHIQPKVATYLIGMSCDNFLPHDEMNVYLKKQYGSRHRRRGDGGDDGSENDDDDNVNTGGMIQFAHDGQILFLPTTTTTTDSLDASSNDTSSSTSEDS